MCLSTFKGYILYIQCKYRVYIYSLYLLSIISIYSVEGTMCFHLDFNSGPHRFIDRLAPSFLCRKTPLAPATRLFFPVGHPIFRHC